MQDRRVQMENHFVRFNWWCPPEIRKQTTFHHGNTDSQTAIDSFHKFQPKIRPARCFRCGQLGHYIKQCTSSIAKPKSHKKILRDNERMAVFIKRKICESLPFSTVDESEFRKIIKPTMFTQCQINAVEVQNLQSQIHTFEVQNDEIKSLNSKLENIIDKIKDEFKDKKKSLNEEITGLKTENKHLKSKLQKAVADNKESKREINILNTENDNAVDSLQTLHRRIDEFRRAEINYKKEIDQWTFRCKELEEIKITTPIEFMTEIDDLKEKLYRAQHRNSFHQNSRSGGRYQGNRGRPRR